MAGVPGCATPRAATDPSAAQPADPAAAPDDRLAALHAVTQQAGANADDFQAYANALFDADLFTEALAAYRAVLERDDNHAAAHCNLGLCYRRLGRIGEAIAAYERSTALEPDNPITLNNLALALELASEWDRLATVRQALAALDPQDPRRQSDLGLALLQAQQFREASRAFETVLGLDPGNAGDYYNLGLCYFYLEQWDRAVTAWLTGVAHNPEDESIRRGLAVVYWKRGDYAQAWQAVADCQALGVRLSPEFIANLQQDSAQTGHTVAPER
jgi:Flp pilus assembly protein TadD